MKKKLILLAAMTLLMVMLCSGCLLVTNAEELYSLPQPTKEFSDLQGQISEVLESGAEYSAPVSGSNRQAIQFKDLDGDGEEEAIAFFSKSGDEPLCITIFNNDEGNYKTAAIIDGDGTAIDSINYADMDGDGIVELIVGWQMSPSVKMLTVYSIRDYQISVLTSTNYERYSVVHLNNSSGMNVMVYRLPSASDMTAEAVIYSLMSDGEMVSASARLSDGIESISNIKNGCIFGKIQAVFVDSVYSGGGIITDILISEDTGKLENITMNTDSRRSEDTMRAYNVYCSDINADGIIEVPQARELQAQSDTVYRIIDWKTFRKNGHSALVMSTYHNYSDSWYLVLPNEWVDKLTIRREDKVSGERVIIFSQITGEGENAVIEDFLAIYSLSGENKEERSNVNGRFVLKSEAETIYAAEILSVDTDMKVDKDLILQNFGIIYTDWLTGT